MCNEVEEVRVDQYLGTVLEPEADPVRVSLVWERNDQEVLFGEYPRAEMLRAGINLELHEEFAVDIWKSPDGRTRTEVRPFVRRQLTEAEVREIHEKLEALLPADGFEEDY